jgi:RNA polymerase sigma factor (sigma-70 family)
VSPLDKMTGRWPEVALAERARLVQLCAKHTGRSDIAEDLAQEALFEAWRHLRSLRDQERFSQWLSGIARNVCLRWARTQRRERVRTCACRRDAEHPMEDLEETLADAFDLEIELERKELADLLDRALAQLPPATRTILIERYIAESPLAEIAASLRIPVGTAAKRLQRGKLAFRRILTTDLKEDLAPYLITKTGDGWEETPLWCFLCGASRLSARTTPENERQFTCLHCHAASRVPLFQRKLAQETRSHRRALSQILTWIEQRYRPYLATRQIPCAGCGRLLPIAISPDHRILQVCCSTCQFSGMESPYSLSLAQAVVRRFWQEQRRIRRLPEQAVEAAGRPAIVTEFESVNSRATIAVVLAQDTYEMLRIVADHSRVLALEHV